MDKFRLRLLICLIFIFVIVSVAFFFALCDNSENISGAIIGTSSTATTSTYALYLPGMIFIGLIILITVYLEKN